MEGVLRAPSNPLPPAALARAGRRRRPRMTSRCIQLRVPAGWTNRYGPLPSARRPGEALRTTAAGRAGLGRSVRQGEFHDFVKSLMLNDLV